MFIQKWIFSGYFMDLNLDTEIFKNRSSSGFGSYVP